MPLGGVPSAVIKPSPGGSLEAQTLTPLHSPSLHVNTAPPRQYVTAPRFPALRREEGAGADKTATHHHSRGTVRFNPSVQHLFTSQSSGAWLVSCKICMGDVEED
jgi:hypothetical protein